MSQPYRLACAPLLTGLVLVVAGALAASPAGAQSVSTGALDGASVVPPTPSSGTGTAEVTIDGRVTMLGENESIYLPLGCVHRLANPGKILLELIGKAGFLA